jgi:hypothetical protein
VLCVSLIVMWTVTMTVILDLGAARLGNIRLAPAIYQWTMDGFSGGAPIPPPP